MTFGIVVLVLWVIFWHWVADFVCQTHWQASNKSKNWNALARHVAVYTGVVTVPIASFLPLHTVFWFLLITFVVHFITDAITSRINSFLFLGEFEMKALYDREGAISGDLEHRLAMRPGFTLHWFFVSVGFDQFLHYAQLFSTISWLGGMQ